MLSQKARYALRALVELARADGAQLTSGELAARADAPRKFLEAILLELSRNRIVTSRRGKFGGYTLGQPPQEISFQATSTERDELDHFAEAVAAKRALALPGGDAVHNVAVLEAIMASIGSGGPAKVG